MTALVAAVIVGIGTYLSRAIFILALAKRKISDSVLLSLQFVAPAVLGALIVALLIDDGRVMIGLPEVIAFLIGGVTAWKTRSHVYTLIVGMTVFWLVRALT